MSVPSTALLADDSDVVCPFCGEGNFDIVGLKTHLVRGWCDKFNETSLDVPHTREANPMVDTRPTGKGENQ